MSYLNTKVKIFHEQEVDIAGKVFHSSGTVQVGEDMLDVYSPDSYLPVMNLKDVSGDPEFIGHHLTDFRTDNSICLTRLPEDLIRLIQNIDIGGIEDGSQQERSSVSIRKVLDIFERKFRDFVRSYALNNANINLHKISFGGRNQLTSTINYGMAPPMKIGLHLDSWDNQPLAERNTSRNRVCFNLGKGHRYFLFIDLAIEEISSKYLGIGPESDLSSHEIVRSFMEKFPSYPVTFLKIDPYEGYIAPTENLIHDGSNFDSQEADIQLTARGLFIPKSIKA